MECYKCKEADFETRTIKVQQKLYGDVFVVDAEAEVCPKCGMKFYSDLQMANLRLLVTNAYRRKQDLLTSDEINGLRRQLGMSQSAFADYLGVGVASVKRWESYFIQERAFDTLLRLKCIPDAAEANYVQLSDKLSCSPAFVVKVKVRANISHVNAYTEITLPQMLQYRTVTDSEAGRQSGEGDMLPPHISAAKLADLLGSRG